MTDSLRSRAYARVLDLVSEGEIEGLVNGDKSIYLNGTPLRAADGTLNFQNVTYTTRNGTNGQSYINGLPGVESATNVSTEVTNAASVTRTITNADVNAVRLTLSVSALYKAKDDGSINGASVQIAIDVQSSVGSYTTVVTDTIEGKAQSKYQRSYLVNLAGFAPWNIRVRRITADSTDLKLQDKTYWDSYTEIIEAKLRYPNSALVSTKFDAASFSGIPSRAFDMKLKRVKVPSNYNPTTRVYSGTWDGTFQTAWTDNPAWVFYDLVTNTRYGLGGYIDASQVDKWALYSIAQYCDELVPDGFGGYEPRFTCNLYLQTRAEAYKVLQDLASCFRAVTYWASGSLTLAQDAPSDPVALYTQANVVDGAFSYSGSSAKARHTVALVTWNDPEDLYKQKVEYVEDADGISRFGVVPTEVVAIGCTSQGQANRVGRWLLFSERYESETVTFQTGIEGAVARPGQVIKVADANRAGVRLGGRVSSATTTTVTVDASPTLGGSSWTMLVMLPDGSVESRAVTSGSGNTITLAAALPSAPIAGAQWILTRATTEAQTFRVLTVTEQEGGKVEITALKHNPDKYDAVENGLVLQSRDITQLDQLPAAPSLLTATESLYTYQAEVRSMISVGWQNVTNASAYLVQWSKDGGNFTEEVTSIPGFDILNTTPGTYVVRVYSLSPLGERSIDRYSLRGRRSAGYATLSINALGKTAPPANVTGFTGIVDPNIGVTLSWDKVADLDLDVYEIREGINWLTATLVSRVKGTTHKIGVVTPSTKTYLVRALDTSGVYSASAASTTVTITASSAPTVTSSIVGENAILTWGAVAGTLATDSYEIRYGTTFGAGTSVATIKGTSFSLKAQWLGGRKFWVAARDIAGNYGAAGSVDVVIAAPTAVTATQEVIDNNVLLKWSDGAATLPVDYYELRKGATWDTATVIGRISGRFTVVFESAAGTYKYWIAGVDVAGNVGMKTNVDALVNQPPNYQLKLDQNSTFSGTKTNMLALPEGGYLLPIDTVEDWQSHFNSRGWTTIQDQINAGFNMYAMPAASSGSYEEIIDYGAVLAATKITTTLTYTTTAGSVTVTPTISVRKLSTDPWTDYAGLAVVYVTDFRYVKVKYAFTQTSGANLVTVTGLNVRFDVKLRDDAGVKTVSASDSGGTVVNFNVSFVDVDSITVTPKGTSARIAVYDFVDAPNPTSFKVLLFDTAGTRQSGDVSWSAKGV